MAHTTKIQLILATNPNKYIAFGLFSQKVAIKHLLLITRIQIPPLALD